MAGTSRVWEGTPGPAKPRRIFAFGHFFPLCNGDVLRPRVLSALALLFRQQFVPCPMLCCIAITTFVISDPAASRMTHEFVRVFRLTVWTAAEVCLDVVACGFFRTLSNDIGSEGFQTKEALCALRNEQKSGAACMGPSPRSQSDGSSVHSL
jgi:hypothetical protein